MKLVTFGVDDNPSLVITFQGFIKVFSREGLVLHEIETVLVPINDLNEAGNSYSMVKISKPYVSITDNITLN